MNQAQSIIGDSSHRKENDFYPTPPYATQALLDREKFDMAVWEPACGEGHMSEVLMANEYKVFSTDLIDRGYDKMCATTKDFLTCSQFVGGLDIITNPPFALGLEFVLQAKKLAKNKIAMLLKTQFLEGVGRYEMFQDKVFPLKCIYRFSKRLTFNAKSGGMLSFAWFVWQKDYVGEPMIRWIK